MTRIALRPSRLTPSFSPLSMCMINGTRQRSLSAGPAIEDVIQGQRTSQLQFSKYSPSSFQDIAPPPVDWAEPYRACRRREPPSFGGAGFVPADEASTASVRGDDRGARADEGLR